MSSAKPTRKQADLADVLELLLDKGIVINADIAVTVGDTELLGVELRAAIASFETAAEYGLAFPSGTDMRRVEQASGREALDADGDEADLGIDASDDEKQQVKRAPSRRPNPTTPFGLDEDEATDADGAGAEDEEASDGQEAESGEGDEADGEAEAEAEAGAEES